MMNERIKELMLEAGFNEVTRPDPLREGWVIHEPAFNAEKFAKLVVKECCDILTDNVEVALNASGSPVYPEGLIREHFGVEE